MFFPGCPTLWSSRLKLAKRTSTFWELKVKQQPLLFESLCHNNNRCRTTRCGEEKEGKASHLNARVDYFGLHPWGRVSALILQEHIVLWIWICHTWLQGFCQKRCPSTDRIYSFTIIILRVLLFLCIDSDSASLPEPWLIHVLFWGRKAASPEFIIWRTLSQFYNLDQFSF